MCGIVERAAPRVPTPVDRGAAPGAVAISIEEADLWVKEAVFS